jgi:hypothetical protein
MYFNHFNGQLPTFSIDGVVFVDGSELSGLLIVTNEK